MIINDELLSPWEIEANGISFIVRKQTGLDKKGKPKYDIDGYYSSLSGAVVRVANILAIESRETGTLKDYVMTLESFKKKLGELLGD